MKYGMQFTSWQDSRKSCDGWFRWFEERDVPAAIIRAGSAFAVFRKGIVGRKAADGAYYSINAPETKGILTTEIMASCHGYNA
jgi:hypothetical protein